jgi:UDP-N-acetylmuramoyl-L-alanyl-D-glutamate--2,6-diaminopimelate ligase
VDTTFPTVTLAQVATVGGAEVRGDPARPLVGATSDSRAVTPGSLFFCIPGEHDDGHRYAPAAVAAGAAALAVERWLPVDVPQAKVASVRDAIGPMSALVFGNPAERLTTVGVTGTNGKTTCTYLLEAILGGAGLVPGVIGTTGARIDGSPVAIERTTPEAPDLQRLLARMLASGVRAVAMEVSSHALAQRRTDGIRFDAAIFTNLSQDHLDFHGTMDAYFEAKTRLFMPAHAAVGVVGSDDPYGRRLIGSAAVPIVTYGVDSGADVRATDVVVGPDGSSFVVDGVRVRTALRGAFNVENCLAALAAARTIGLDLDAAGAALSTVERVPGRMEVIDDGRGVSVVVDYAHTPDSIRVVLRGARSLAAGRVLVVFGCGGERDRAKRPSMGFAATSGADLTVITSDNPRSEDPLAIIQEIVPGAAEGGGRYVVEPDRRAAIRLALHEARPGDVVVVAGKGHERVQEVGGSTIPFDDRAVVREELAALGDPA